MNLLAMNLGLEPKPQVVQKGRFCGIGFDGKPPSGHTDRRIPTARALGRILSVLAMADGRQMAVSAIRKMAKLDCTVVPEAMAYLKANGFANDAKFRRYSVWTIADGVDVMKAPNHDSEHADLLEEAKAHYIRSISVGFEKEVRDLAEGKIPPKQVQINSKGRAGLCVRMSNAQHKYFMDVMGGGEWLINQINQHMENQNA